MARLSLPSALPRRARSALGRRVYVCHYAHPNDRLYAENISDYLGSLSVDCQAMEFDPASNAQLQQCLNDDALAIVGFNAALDHAWIGSEEFLKAAFRRDIPVIQWILDHPSTRWPEFQSSDAANSRYLLMSEYAERYFRRYCLPGALTGVATTVGPSRHSRIQDFSATSFSARHINCLIPMNFKRVGGTVDETRARIERLSVPLAHAVNAAIASARFDLITPIETHLMAEVKPRDLNVVGNTFNLCLQMIEEVVQYLRRRHVAEVASRFPVRLQSDPNIRTIWPPTAAATLIENVGMKSTLQFMRSARAVVSISHINDMIHDRTVNGLNAGCVNIIEDNAVHRRWFEHGKNALLFRYDDDSLEQCLDLVCHRPTRAYEIAAAGLAMRDELPFRFGGYHNFLELARQPITDRWGSNPIVSARGARHTFQSFWWGQALSPYEVLCLKSFVACGFGFDLYTYDRSITVPAGVRLRDASELFGEDQLFVYEGGFGAGSPSAFSNLFRYKLLAERGGWWTDTDVVCLSRQVPDFAEFFARQDDEFVNGGVLYFPPRHPVVLDCLDQAMKLGRDVRWGDTGPRLLTRVLQQHGYIDRAASPTACYPIHFWDAVEMLRPSQTSALIERTRSSFFLHLWNEMLSYAGIEKTRIPPKNSLLRGLIDTHQVGGWTGEYDQYGVEQLVAQYRARPDVSAATGLSAQAPASLPASNALG